VLNWYTILKSGSSLKSLALWCWHLANNSKVVLFCILQIGKENIIFLCQKFCEHSSATFWVILLTDKQTYQEMKYFLINVVIIFYWRALIFYIYLLVIMNATWMCFTLGLFDSKWWVESCFAGSWSTSFWSCDTRFQAQQSVFSVYWTIHRCRYLMLFKLLV